MPAVPGKEPVRLPEDHWRIESLARDPRALTRPVGGPSLPGLRMGSSSPQWVAAVQKVSVRVTPGRVSPVFRLGPQAGRLGPGWP